MPVPQLAPLVVALIGCITDIWSRRIPNVLTLGAALGAAGYYLVERGVGGLGFATLGWLVGGLLFLPLFVLRGLGGGDVKLLAALGAWVGPEAAVWLALYTALAGGIFAVAIAARHGYLLQALRNTWSILTFWRVAGIRPHPSLRVDAPGNIRLPYALPIAVGLAVTLWRG